MKNFSFCPMIKLIYNKPHNVFKIIWLSCSPTLVLVVLFVILQAFSLIICFVAKNKTKTHLLHIYSFASNPKHCPNTICYDLKYGSRKIGNAYYMIVGHDTLQCIQPSKCSQCWRSIIHKPRNWCHKTLKKPDNRAFMNEENTKSTGFKTSMSSRLPQPTNDLSLPPPIDDKIHKHLHERNHIYFRAWTR